MFLLLNVQTGCQLYKNDYIKIENIFLQIIDTINIVYFPDVYISFAYHT